MSKLNAKERSNIPSGQFALPGRRYPLNDENHARSALSMAHYASPSEQTTIRRKVHSRFPSIGKPKASAQAKTYARVAKAYQDKKKSD